jgi:signal recognition particle GTPase
MNRNISKAIRATVELLESESRYTKKKIDVSVLNEVIIDLINAEVYFTYVDIASAYKEHPEISSYPDRSSGMGLMSLMM